MDRLVLTAASTLGPPGTPISGDQARRAAQQELRKAQYHRDDPSAAQRVWNWIEEKLSHLTSHASSGQPNAIIAILVLAALVAALGYAIYRAGPLRRRRVVADQQDPLAANPDIDHREVARRHEAGGEWASALREWLRDCVAEVERRGILDPRPGRTAAELASAAGRRLPTAAAALSRAAHAFDEVFYARRRADAADAELGRLASDAVRDARVATTEPDAAAFVVPA